MAWQWKVLVRAGAALAAAVLAAEGCGHGSIDLFAENAAESGGAGGDSTWPVGLETGGDNGQGGGRNSSGGSGPWPIAGCDLQHPCLTGLVCNNVGNCVQCTGADPSQCGDLGLVCNTLRSLCVECYYGLDGNCQPGSACDSYSNSCRLACRSDDNCGGATPHCRSDGLCVECDPNSLNDECHPGFWCMEGGFCGQCLYDQHCAFPEHCNAAHVCVECIVDAQCGDARRCDLGTCVARVTP
jgi:hypothetical protein